jgi:SpoVK/Ycf46/Vps4 family AAA+-type ATPase
MQRIATRSKGYSGAELSNVVNEAALLAVRAGLGVTTQACFEEALERNNQSRKLALQLDGFGNGGMGVNSTVQDLHNKLQNRNRTNLQDP